jgi:hypothetical protein
MSQLEVDKVIPQSGTTLTLGDSADTITIPSGATLDASNATLTLPSTVVTTTGSQTLTNKTIDASQLTGTITPSDNTVSLAKLSATGTKDATTFLRGDNTFASAGGTNTPAFLAHVSGSAFSLANATQTKVIFNSEKYDTASAYNTSTALFTVPSGEGGKYFLCSQLFMGGASASRFIMIMRLNSSSNLIYMDGEKTAPCTVFASTVRTLSAGDTVHIEASQNSGSAQNLDYSPTAEVNYFYGYKLIE